MHTLRFADITLDVCATRGSDAQAPGRRPKKSRRPEEQVCFADSGNWRIMFTCAVIPSLALLVALIFLPESPRCLGGIGPLR
jgi:hypothetical protein